MYDAELMLMAWDSDPGAVMSGVAGLKGFAVRRNANAEPGGEGWECSADLEGGPSVTAQGYTPGAAILLALMDLTEQQAKRPVLRLV